MECYDIHISFREQEKLFLCLLGQMQSVQILALIEQLSLRRIQVLRSIFRLAHDTAAEGYDPASLVHDREYDSVPELIICTFLIYRKQPACCKLFVSISFCL